MTRRAFTFVFTMACCLSSAQTVRAEFSLNFQPVDDRPVIATHIVHGDAIIQGHTPFLTEGPFQLPELVADPESGAVYYHMIIGDQADGFIQETFIEAGFRAFPGGSGSAAGGDGGADGGNGQDPLGRDPRILTDNASGNPRRVLIRQIVTDGEINMEYLKDRYDRKALITQSLAADELNADFSLDMRNSTYDDDTTPGLISNTMNISGQGGVGSFDMATDVQTSAISAGRYTYSDGPGPGGSSGSYQYFDGGFDHVNQDWEVFFDETADNPWSYPENRP